MVAIFPGPGDERKAVMLRRILVPVDATHVASQALRFAFNLAERTGAKVLMLHAYTAQDDTRAAISEATATAHRVIGTVAIGLRRHPSFGRAMVKMGAMRDVVVQIASDTSADLIVMPNDPFASDGMTVAEEIIVRAPCPVLSLTPGTIRSLVTSHSDTRELRRPQRDAAPKTRAS